MKRQQSWQLAKARTAKGLRELPKCANAGCDKRAMGTGWVLLASGKEQLHLLCPSHAQQAQRAKSVCIQSALRSGT